MFDYKFPDIGEGITEGTLTKWLVQEGDQVKEGQDLAEIETDKMTTTLPSAATGTIHKIHVPNYGTLEVGKTFVTIDDGSGKASAEAAPEKAEEPIKESPVPDDTEAIVGGPKAIDDAPSDKVEEEAGVVGELISSQDELPPSDEGQVQAKPETTKKKVLATPVARQMAKDLGVNIQEIEGTGPGGRIMKEDIQQFADKKPVEQPVKEEVAVTKPAAMPMQPGDNERREPLTRIRKTIAQRMTESKQGLVHTTTIEEIEVSDLVAFRKKMKAIAGEDVKLTYLPFIIKAIVLGLKEFPIINSSFDEASEEIVYKLNYNIGIATDTERGLVVPVVFDADKKSIIELAKGIDELATLANDGLLTLEHLRGGTFTITNYGAIGGAFGTPIINFPEAAILGIGRITEKPVVKDGEIVIGHTLPLSLSFDHRMIDGAVGVRFMKFVGEALQNPELLLLRS